MNKILVTEKRSKNEIYYERTVVLSEGKRITTFIRPQTAIVKCHNEEYFIIYDSKMNINRDVFRFLNYGYDQMAARNTKIKSLEALKFLITFEELIDKKLQNFNLEDVNGLKDFLSGNFSKLQGNEYRLDLITNRSHATVNGYLSVYRNYLTYLGINNHYLFTKSMSQNKSFVNQHNAKYKSSKNLPTQYIEVPEYISIEHYANILKVIKQDYTLREECIIKLMFEEGLRIGEILGLTLEDLQEIKDVNGNYENVLFIRNRVSDKKDQVAKGCMTVKSLSQYSSKDYNTEAISGGGYQKVSISNEMADLIIEYIETAHAKANSTKEGRLRYKSQTKADKVIQSINPYDNENYYLFLNEIGTPLRQDSWNKILKKIFIECDIPLDKDKRLHNLNHRFRHSFGIYMAKMGVDVMSLAQLMRHSDVNSSQPYTKMTTSDQIKIKTDFANYLHSIIPNLYTDKEDNND